TADRTRGRPGLLRFPVLVPPALPAAGRARASALSLVARARGLRRPRSLGDVFAPPRCGRPRPDDEGGAAALAPHLLPRRVVEHAEGFLALRTGGLDRHRRSLRRNRASPALAPGAASPNRRTPGRSRAC